MYCRNCGKEVHAQAVACPACGVPPLLEKKFCQNCGKPTQPNQALCTECGTTLAGAGPGDKSRVVAGVLGILLGGLGIHKFYLGYTREAVIMLLISVVGGLFTFGLAWAAMWVVGLVEGIIYIVKTDPEFAQTYVAGRRGWF